MNKFQILVVEDDPPVRNLITTTLKAHDYRFTVAANGKTAVMEAARTVTKSLPWTQGQTTTRPNPFPWKSCWPGCGSPSAVLP